MPASAQERFQSLLHDAVGQSTLQKLTLGKYRGSDSTVKNLFVRPVVLKTGPHLTFLWRHATRDITKNLTHAEALPLISRLVGRDFLDAHLFTANQNAQLECQPETGRDRLKITTGAAPAATPENSGHNREKHHLIPASAGWLHALGVTNDRGAPREGMAAKFRQIQKFTELLSHLFAESGLLPKEGSPAAPLQVADMGSGKGYLTFAVSELLGARAQVSGIEVRPELVELCNRIAREQNFSHLHFKPGSIAEAPLGALDVLIALHACDTATDDALAQGIAAGARLLVVSPCCQKEIRAQLVAPPILADALHHGIFQERQAEFATDALRAQLLEWAGYQTKVFEFITTEHTAKNLMIAAIKIRPAGDPALATRVRAFAAFYGIKRQQLATHLNFDFSAP